MLVIRLFGYLAGNGNGDNGGGDSGGGGGGFDGFSPVSIRISI